MDTTDILQSIKHPEQREMIRRYRIAQNMLQGSNVNMNEYDEAFKDFSVLKNRQRIASMQSSPPVKRQSAAEVNKNNDNDDESLVDTLPENQRMYAKKIIRVLRSHGKDLVSCTPEGDVSIRGEPLQRVNFTDLLSGVVRSRPSRNIPPSYEKFLKALVTVERL